MLTIWGRPSAYNFQKVHWFLEELGVEYEHINVGGARGGLDSDEFLAMNPNGRIPVIKDNGQVIWESNTILRYLASTYGANEYWSDSPVDRALFERWMDWELSTLQPAFLGLFWSFYRSPESQRDNKKIKHYLQRCEYLVQILDIHLGGNEYVSGNSFGLGDVCVGTCFYRYFNMGIDVTSSDNVSHWYTRLSERACYKQVIQVSFDELKGRLEF